MIGPAGFMQAPKERRRSGELPVQGDRVVVPANVPVVTTGPRKNFTTKRRQTVTVVSVYSNRNSIRWAGSGGYWCEVSIEDIVQKGE